MENWVQNNCLRFQPTSPHAKEQLERLRTLSNMAASLKSQSAFDVLMEILIEIQFQTPPSDDDDDDDEYL